MGVIQLPDELQRVIELQVAEGRAASSAAFLEEAVRRLVDEARGEEDELFLAVEAGSADIEAGRYVMVATPEGRTAHPRRHDGTAAGSHFRRRLIGLPAHQGGRGPDRCPLAR